MNIVQFEAGRFFCGSRFWGGAIAHAESFGCGSGNLAVEAAEVEALAFWAVGSTQCPDLDPGPHLTSHEQSQLQES